MRRATRRHRMIALRVVDDPIWRIAFCLARLRGVPWLRREILRLGGANAGNDLEKAIQVFAKDTAQILPPAFLLTDGQWRSLAEEYDAIADVLSIGGKGYGAGASIDAGNIVARQVVVGDGSNSVAVLRESLGSQVCISRGHLHSLVSEKHAFRCVVVRSHSSSECTSHCHV